MVIDLRSSFKRQLCLVHSSLINGWPHDSCQMVPIDCSLVGSFGDIIAQSYRVVQKVSETCTHAALGIDQMSTENAKLKYLKKRHALTSNHLDMQNSCKFVN